MIDRDAFRYQSLDALKGWVSMKGYQFETLVTNNIVRFPDVSFEGGNPLDLHCNGIPHLFIIKANGVLLEEGHPASLFTEEKLRELKSE